MFNTKKDLGLKTPETPKKEPEQLTQQFDDALKQSEAHEHHLPPPKVDIEEHFISFYMATKKLLGNRKSGLKINITDGEIILRLSRDLD